MNYCLHCGSVVASEAADCPRCGRRQPRQVEEGPARLGSFRPGMMLGAAVAVGLAIVGLWGEWRLARLERRLAAEREFIRASAAEDAALHAEALRQQLADHESVHQKRVTDADLVGGHAGTRARNAEWERRVAHDPAFAISALETNLLRMSRLGADPRVSARDALREVGLLAAPPGSRVEVTPEGDRFLVQVAFKMSELTENEAGAVTKHANAESLRREVEEISARVLRELYDSCGTRGIASLQVSCNHAVRQSPIPDAATPAERREILSRAPEVMDKLYRMRMDGATAMTIADWRRVSVSELLRRMTVDYDGFDKLTLSQGDGSSGPGSDPETPLKF
ncbi:MAG: hypothetical protein J0L84_13670 [Verrucomicrobia bacterium]|nr:hypothetical protein [Verrucomicrobiota bacterium]